MKKTLVALTVAALAATSANAATLYDADGTKVELTGSLRLHLSKDNGERFDLDDADSRMEFSVSHDLGNGFSALGAVRLLYRQAEDTADDVDDDQVNADQVYAGFAQADVGTLTFGKQLTTGDDLGVSDYTYELGGINQVYTDSDKAIKFLSADMAGFKVGATYTFSDNKIKNEARDGRGAIVGLFYNGELADGISLEVDAGYGYQAKGTSSFNDTYHTNAFTVGTALNIDRFSVAVDYSQIKASDDNKVKFQSHDYVVVETYFEKVRLIELGMQYRYLDNASVYGEYIWGKASATDAAVAAGQTDGDLHQWIVGSDYTFNGNVETYIEGGSATYKSSGNRAHDNALRVGMRVYF